MLGAWLATFKDSRRHERARTFANTSRSAVDLEEQSMGAPPALT